MKGWRRSSVALGIGFCCCCGYIQQGKSFTLSTPVRSATGRFAYADRVVIRTSSREDLGGDCTSLPKTVVGLKEALRELGLPVSGKKSDLETRLTQALQPEISTLHVNSVTGDESSQIRIVEPALESISTDDEDRISHQSLDGPDESQLVNSRYSDEKQDQMPKTQVRTQDFIDVNNESNEEMFSYFATCARGLEMALKQELQSDRVRAKEVRTGGGGCHFKGGKDVGYRALLWLRTPHRILHLITQGAGVQDREGVYELTASVNWQDYMENSQTLSVDAVLGNVPEGLTHSHFTALTVKNAIVDQFRASSQSGTRPSVNPENPDLPLSIYIDNGKALLYRSLSGVRSMHKRGYREAMHAASLKENVAAGLLILSGWDPETQPLCDPMCGSGTFVIEGASIAMHRAPGLQALGYFNSHTNADGQKSIIRSAGAWVPSVSRWPDFDSSMWRAAVSEAKSAALDRPPQPIMASDWHEGALSLAFDDATRAGVVDFIEFYNEDVAAYVPPTKPGMIVTNPPWDMRLGGAKDSWRALMPFLKEYCDGIPVWALSGNPAASRELRFRPTKSMFLRLGTTQLQWLNYDMLPKKESTLRWESQEKSGGRARGERRPKSPRAKAQAPW